LNLTISIKPRCLNAANTLDAAVAAVVEVMQTTEVDVGLEVDRGAVGMVDNRVRTGRRRRIFWI
jgi:hypothetical protein